MTRIEFAKVIAYITAGSGKALSADSLEVYFDCLGDLSFEVGMVAAKRVVLEHRWATFPSVAELREAATDSLAGQVAALSAAEAWRLAWSAVAKIDPEIDGSFERATKTLPPLVVEAIHVFGLNALCYGDEPLGVVRGQFLKIFEQLSSREKRAALLPVAVRKAIEGIGSGALPEKIAPALLGIGRGGS